MKFRAALIASAASVLLFPAAARANEAIDGKMREIRELLSAGEADPPELAAQKQQAARFAEVIGMAVEQGKPEMLQMSDPGLPGLAAKVRELRELLAAEAKRKEEAELERIDALFEEAGGTLVSAKKPEDLDGLLVKLGSFRLDEFRGSPDAMAKAQQLRGASQMTAAWQSYLMDKEAGNVRGVNNHLQQISTQLVQTPLVPRSTVLRLMASGEDENAATRETGTPAMDEALGRVAETGDMAAAAAAMAEISNEEISRFPNGSALVNAVQALVGLERLEPSMTDTEVMARSRSLQVNTTQQHVFQRAIDRILLRSVARNFGMEAPAAEEVSPRKFLESIAEEAVKKEDWARLRKALTSLENLQSGSGYNVTSTRLAGDLKILSLMELGAAAEEREDHGAAVSAYLDAMALEGQMISKEVPYNRLADLRAKSPEKVRELEEKVAEAKRSDAIARDSAMMEARQRTMHERMSMSHGFHGGGPMNPAALKPMVQEVVAEFLQGKRMEALKPEPAAEKPEVEEPAAEETSEEEAE